MNLKQILCLVVVVLGIALVANAKFAMERTGETVRKKITGHYTSGTRIRLYTGAGVAVLGVLAIIYFRGNKKK
jgi:hypothetical protein